MRDENKAIILDTVTSLYRKHSDYRDRFSLAGIARICDEQSDTRIFGGSVRQALELHDLLNFYAPSSIENKSYKDAEPEVRLQLCYRLLTDSNTEAAEKTGKSPSTVGGHWDTYGASFEADITSVEQIHEKIASTKLKMDLEAT